MNTSVRKSVITIGADRRMSGYAPRSRYRLPILAVAGLAALSGLLLAACGPASSDISKDNDLYINCSLDSAGSSNNILNPGYDPLVARALSDNSGITDLASFNSFESVGKDFDEGREGLRDGDLFGGSIARLGDLNGDGFQEVVVGAIGEEPLGSGGTNNGAIWTVSLNRDGTARPNPVRIGHGCPTWLTIGGNENFGSALANIGDRNDDGITDIAVGASAYKYLAGRRTESPGAVYIFYLNADGTVQPNPKVLTEATEGNDVGIPSIALVSFIRGGVGSNRTRPSFGRALADIGDLNGDGISDLAVGAPDTSGCTRATTTHMRVANRSSEDWETSIGALYILLMDENEEVLEVIRHGWIANLDANRCVASSNLPATVGENSEFGSSVAALGDIDDDGVPDLAVSELTPSDTKVHILFMEATGMIERVETIVPSDVDSSISAGSEFGAALAALGEINGDVYLAIGAPEQGNNGAVYIVTLENDGSVKQLVRTINGDGGADRPASPRGASTAAVLDSRCGDPGVLVAGSSTSKDGFGNGIASLGDLNNDGLLDLAIGAPGWNDLAVRVMTEFGGRTTIDCIIEADYGVVWTFQ